MRTASAARRVVEDLVAPRAAQQGAGVDDNLMVWVSRLIDQDVNIFSGAAAARHERAQPLRVGPAADAHAGRRLPRPRAARTSATTVVREQIGALSYLVAAHVDGHPRARRDADRAADVARAADRRADRHARSPRAARRAASSSSAAPASATGWPSASPIPVNRLTRATRRIARGDLDARIAATSSDELRRLVEDFNRMAGELQRQRKELERTHRLEAWAEMARQVAHEIKNPLTPIQLNAEHLRRVHADRGEPLSPVLEECVATILTQVKLLRQIASEFSSFASSPTARPARGRRAGAASTKRSTPIALGLRDRIRFDVDVPGDSAAGLRRSHAGRALAHQHRRERAARDARRRRARRSSRARSIRSCRSGCRTPASAWTRKRSRARSSRTSRPRRPAPDSDCRSPSGTSS